MKPPCGGIFQLPTELLESIYKRFPDLVINWVETALRVPSLLQISEGFYQSLCSALSDSAPELAFSLWHTLNDVDRSINFLDETGYDLMTRIPYLSHSQQAQKVQDELLNLAANDAELLKLACVATACNHSEWLDNKIKTLLSSPILWQRAKAIMLAAFSDLEMDFDKLCLDADVSNTWVGNILNRSKEIYMKNQWARHWYKRFLTVDNNDEAYSAFVVF